MGRHEQEREVVRDSRSGRFTTEEDAAARPAETVHETVHVPDATDRVLERVGVERRRHDALGWTREHDLAEGGIPHVLAEAHTRILEARAAADRFASLIYPDGTTRYPEDAAHTLAELIKSATQAAALAVTALEYLDDVPQPPTRD